MLDCNARYCSQSVSYANKGTCQQCKDVEDCYGDTNNSTTVCGTWDETRCPGGVVTPNYEDPARIENTVFSKRLRVIKPEERTLYYCPNFGELSQGRLMLAAVGRLNVKSGDILASAQAGGVFHKLYGVTHLFQLTLMTAQPASLRDVIRYADFSEQKQIHLLDDETSLEQTPSDSLLGDGHAQLDSANRLHNLEAVNVYKCKGRSYLTSDGKTGTTHHLVLETDRQDNSTYRVEDLLVSRHSSGFLETVLGTWSTSVGTVVNTTLTECSNLDTTTLTLSHPLRKKSCVGGDNNAGLLMFDKGSPTNVDIGDVVPGRDSFAIFAKVLKVRYSSGFVILEVANIERIENGTAITRLNPDDISRGPVTRRKRDIDVTISGSNVQTQTSGVSWLTYAPLAA